MGKTCTWRAGSLDTALTIIVFGTDSERLKRKEGPPRRRRSANNGVDGHVEPGLVHSLKRKLPTGGHEMIGHASGHEIGHASGYAIGHTSGHAIGHTSGHEWGARRVGATSKSNNTWGRHVSANCMWGKVRYGMTVAVAMACVRACMAGGGWW